MTLTDNKILTRKQLAKKLQVSERTIYRWEKLNLLPKAIKIPDSKFVRYDWDIVLNHLNGF